MTRRPATGNNSPLAYAKRSLLKLLAAKAIAVVEIPYDGEGDSGQIDTIAAYDANKRPVRLDRPVKLALRHGDDPAQYASLQEALDDFAWMVLGEYHGGFENNDGGFGTITIGVADRKVTVDHNGRITDVCNTVTEV